VREILQRIRRIFAEGVPNAGWMRNWIRPDRGETAVRLPQVSLTCVSRATSPADRGL
jgi:hypothetical protein